VTKQGYLFAFGWFASGISWVHVSIDKFGGMPLAFSLLLMLLLCLYLAIYPAIACYLSVRFSSTKQINLWLLPSFWLLAEYLRGVFLTGFPWLSLGYSQIDSPLAVLAPVMGEVGITFVMLLLCVCFTHIINIVIINTSKNKSTIDEVHVKTPMIIITVCIAAITSLHSVNWINVTEKKIKVALVQGNIKQEMKWSPDQEWPTMLKYLDLTRANYDADLIIWPENAVPSMEPIAQDFLDTANKAATINDSAIITGIINYNFESKEYFNSLIVLGKKRVDDSQGSYYYNNANRYYKNHLLPIGEFVPFQEFLRPLAPLFNLPQSSFNRGNYIQPNLIANGLEILPLICFEIAFPEQLAANITASTNLLLTVSNDAWFGDSHGPHQHLEIARMRALEFGRPLLRSTNNGITAVVDHLGKVSARIPQFEEAVLKTNIRLVAGNTPFSLFGRPFAYGFAAIFLVVIFYISRRKKLKNILLCKKYLATKKDCQLEVL
jgi:apolipoprotein N-acyltransferase